MEDQVIEQKEFHPFANELKKATEALKPKVTEEPANQTDQLVEKINQETKEEPKVEAVSTTEEKPKEPEPAEALSEPEFSFGEPEAKEVSQPTDVFKKIGSALEFGELKDESELIAKVNELRTERDNLKKATDVPYEGVPDVLKEAIEAAKKGADWQSLMGASIDYSKVDPIQVFEYEYEMQLKHRYQTPDGKIDYDKLDADLDSFPEAEKVMRGNDIIRQKVAEQAARKASILAAAERQQNEFNSKLSESTNNASKLFPKERYGVTFEQKHIDYLREGIVSRNLIKKHLGSIDESTLTRLDADKLARTIAAAEMVGNISEFRYKQGQVDKARELLAKNTNAAIETSAVPARPEVTGDKPLTPQEKLARYQAQFGGQGRL